MISPEVLRRLPVFAGVSPGALTDIAMFCREVHVEAGAYVFEEGEEAENIYLILEGQVDLLMSIDLYNKSRVDIETIIEGELLGWSAIIEPHIYKLSSVALSDVRVVAIDGMSLRDYLSEDPAAGLAFMMNLASVISERLTKMRLRFMSLVTPEKD